MTNILATLSLLLSTNVTTNWHQSHESRTLMWPPEANITTYHEVGIIHSNVTAVVCKDGFPMGGVTVENRQIGTVQRSYVVKNVREYSKEYFTPSPTNVFFKTYPTNGTTEGFIITNFPGLTVTNKPNL